MMFNKKVLKNGLRLITVPMKDNPTATVLVLVEAGSKYETKNINGLSHFLEHMCFKGTERRPHSIDISRELDSIGAQYNAFTSQEFTGYYAKAHSKHADKIVDVISDIYLHSILPEEEIEKEKGVIIEEINMYNDLPQKKVQDVFMSLLYGDQPAGWDIAGAKETVSAMKRADFADYRKKFYVSPSTVVAVAGSFDENKIIADIEKRFSGADKDKSPGKPAVQEKQTKPALLVAEKETDQSHFVLGVRTFNAYDRRNPVLKALSGVLCGGMSSRLFQKMREELGICYYINASPDSFTDHGFFSVSAGVKNDRLNEAVVAIVDELRKIKTELVPEMELKKTKDFIIGNMYLGLESSDAVADFYGFQEILNKPIKTPEAVAGEINAVSAEEIRKLAGDIFDDRSLNLAVISPPVDQAGLQKVLKF